MYNRHFHWAVNAASHRPLLIRIIESLWLRVGPQISYSVQFDVQGGDVIHSAYHPHRQVIAALRNGDGASAATAMAYDISRAGQITVAHLKSIEGNPGAAEKTRHYERRERQTPRQARRYAGSVEDKKEITRPARRPGRIVDFTDPARCQTGAAGPISSSRRRVFDVL